MRSIRDLLKNDEKVWVYLDSSETWEKFVRMAVDEGFSFGKLPADEWKSGYIAAVHSNGSMGHLPLFIWCMSFAKDMPSVRKADFKRYIEGEEEYSCESSHFKMRLYSGQN